MTRDRRLRSPSKARLLSQRLRQRFEGVGVVFRVGQTDDECVVGILWIDPDVQADVADPAYMQAGYSLALLENRPAGLDRMEVDREAIVVAAVFPRTPSKRVRRRAMVGLVDPALAPERTKHE